MDAVTCRRCRRPLRSEASRAAGIGGRCAAIEAATQGLKPEQAGKAREVAADGGVVKVRPGVYRVSATSGEEAYVTAVTGQCTCPWGCRRASAAQKTCYHVAAARLAARPVLRPAPAPAPRRAIPLPPAPGDVWAALAAVGAVTADDMVPAF